MAMHVLEVDTPRALGLHTLTGSGIDVATAERALLAVWNKHVDQRGAEAFWRARDMRQLGARVTVHHRVFGHGQGARDWEPLCCLE